MAKDSYEIWLKAVRKRLDAVAIDAEPLLSNGRYDDAERLVRQVNDDIYGAVTLGTLFTRALETCVQAASPDRARAEVLFERALRWRSAWPEPHTREEAERANAHRDSVEAELRALLAILDR